MVWWRRRLARNALLKADTHGSQPIASENTNLMMARDFGRCTLHRLGLADPRPFHSSPLQSTGIDPRHGDILETVCQLHSEFR
jgi:hypothetical protein